MAQTNYTPILLYASGTPSNTPLAANLTSSASGAELALNYADGKLFYKDSGGVVQVLATKGTGPIGGSNTQVQYNSSGALAGSANLTFDGTTLTANTLNLTNALTTAYGGTGLTSYTAGDLPYYATGTALSKLTIGASGRYLSSSGTAPQWTAPAALTKTDDTNVTLTLGGSASTALLNAASLTLGWTGQLATTRGGTGLSSFTANGVVYASSTSALTTGSALTFDGTNFATTGTISGTNHIATGGSASGNSMYLATTNALGWSTNGTERMRLDSSGNLGLGVTPSAWNTYPALQIARAGLMGASNDLNLAVNAYYKDGGWKYIASAAAALYNQSGSVHSWYTSASGTAGNAITLTQAMTLDASGGLSVGAPGTNYPYINKDAYYVDGGYAAYIKGTSTSGGFSAITFFTQSTERARIDSSGNLLVGYTGIPDATHAGTAIGANPASQSNVVATTATTTVRLWKFINGNGQVGAVATNGSATAYETSSDYRLKEDIAPMTGALAKISQLKPVTYKWKVDGSEGEGFIAHELQEIVPQCVSGTKDAVDENGNPEYQGIDTSFLVATLTAAIQEQQAIIEQLKADVASLKG